MNGSRSLAPLRMTHFCTVLLDVSLRDQSADWSWQSVPYRSCKYLFSCKALSYFAVGADTHICPSSGKTGRIFCAFGDGSMCSIDPYAPKACHCGGSKQPPYGCGECKLGALNSDLSFCVRFCFRAAVFCAKVLVFWAFLYIMKDSGFFVQE